MMHSGARAALLCALLATAAACQTSNIIGSTTGRLGPAQCPTNSTREPDGTCDCYPNYTECSDDAGEPICAQVLLDNDNCGACGVVCPTGESCLGGACQCHLTTCDVDGGEVCIDTQSDPLNCKICGVVCPILGGHCSLGSCTGCDGSITESYCDTDAGPACVDLTHDAYNCGACHNICLYGPCAPGDAGTGVCGCDAPFELCGVTCVDPRSDFNHCGGCTACLPPATQCIVGGCR